MKTKNIHQIDFRRNPYRGVFKEVAGKRQMSIYAVWASFRRKNPDTVRAVKAAIKRRETEIS